MVDADKTDSTPGQILSHFLSHPRRFWTFAPVFSLLVTVCLSAFLTTAAENQNARALAVETNRHAMDIASRTINGKIMGSLGFLGISSLTSKQIAMGDLPAEVPRMLDTLEYLGRYYGAEGCFLVDGAGIVQTSWDSAGRPSTGMDVKFRPYFQIAMRGKENIYAAVSMSTGQRALYLAAPIFENNTVSSPLVGAVSLRLGLDRIDEFLGSWGVKALLLTPNGVVFSSSDPDWIFRLAGEIPAERIKDLNASRQFGTVYASLVAKTLPFDPSGRFVRFGGHRYAVASAPVDWNDPQGQWTLVTLRDVSGPFWSPGRLLAASGAGAAALLLLFAAHLAARNAQVKRQAVRSIRRSQAEMTQIFNTAASGMRVISRDFIVKNVNEAFLALTGYTREELVGHPCHEFFGGGACDTENCTLQRMLAGEKLVESVALKSRKDGTPVYCELTATPFLSPEGEFLGIIEDFRDITERLQAQATVRKSEAKYRELVESASSIILKLDMDGNITFFNEFAQEFFGYTEEEILGRPLIGTIVEPGLIGVGGFGEFLRAIAEGSGKFEKNENENIRKDGSRVWVSWTNRALFDDVFGEVNGLLCIGQDSTERKKAQDALGEAMEIISGSIRYASRIQRAILPSSGILDGLLPRSFTLWQPRDVVGGDIYWVKESPDGLAVILADCTGHGVPGAFMTLIASGALDRACAMTPLSDPAGLIARLNAYVKVVLGQECIVRQDDCSDDGLELGVCFIPADRRTLTYAGAHFPLFVVQDGAARVIKGDRKGIGYRSQSMEATFTNHHLELEPGMRFYMATDGVFDQIGGQKRRSYGKNRFIELLLSLRDRPLDTQGEAIYAAFLAYQGQERRRDDVSIVGFEV